MVRSTKRQKIKNLLLLLCRTLFILCLLVALSNPLYQKSDTSGLENAASLFIIHNGVWGSIQNKNGIPLIDMQLNYLHTLDSLTGKENKKLYVVSSTDRNTPYQIHHRFSNYQQVFKSVLDILNDKPGTFNKIFIPVFNWADLVEYDTSDAAHVVQ